VYGVIVCVKEHRLKAAAQKQPPLPVVDGDRAPANGAHDECIPLQL
jgi:hypothetical protein